MKHIATFIFIISLLPISFSQEKHEINWITDIEYLKQNLPQKHINIFTQINESEFKKELDAIITKLPELSDLQVAIKIQQCISKMGDSHTNVGWVNFVNKDLKMGIESYWFKEGLYIIHSYDRDSILLGKKIIGIGGIKTNIIVDSLKTMFVNENQSIAKNIVPALLLYPELLRHFGCKISNHSMEFEVTDSKNQVIQHQVRLNAKGKTISLNKSSEHLINGSSDWFVEKYDESNHIYFVQYNRCDSKELAIKFSQPQDVIDKKPSFDEFKQKVLETIEEKPIEKFVFDMRFNRGGSSKQGTEFIEELAKHKKINQHGNLFVLIGRKTFSSAIINTLDFQEKTKAILVGEQTGGKASHFGEIRSFKLPDSQLRVTYSTKYFYYNKKNKVKIYISNKGIDTEKDERKTIEPNEKIELSIIDFLNNRDPALDLILKK